MTSAEFSMLPDEAKISVAFSETKVLERQEGFFKYELFRVKNFYVEIRTSAFILFRRSITTYNSSDIPQVYTSNQQVARQGA